MVYHRLLVNQVRKSAKFGDQLDMNEVKIKELISSLKFDERQLLYDRLREVLADEEMARRSTPLKPKSKLLAWFLGLFSSRFKKYIKMPTGSQLTSLFAFHSLPYLAFGCMDNCIMITAGEMLNTSIGAAMGRFWYRSFVIAVTKCKLLFRTVHDVLRSIRQHTGQLDFHCCGLSCGAHLHQAHQRSIVHDG